MDNPCNNLLVGPTKYPWEMVWIDHIFDNKTTAPLEKVNSAFKNLLIGYAVSSWETSYINCTFDNNATVPMKKVNDSCNNLLTGLFF